MRKLLENLVKTPCVPGFQDEMESFLEGEVDFAEVERDRLGNMKLGPGSSEEPKVALLAHLNEISFSVEHIEDSGFLRFQKTSDVDERSLLGKRMMIYGGEGGIRGVVGAKPPHLLRGEEKKKQVKIEDMFIDIGASSREEVEEWGVNVGDPIVLEGWLKVLSDGRVVGKSIDDRAGCAVVIEALRSLLSDGEGEIVAWLLSQETSFPKEFSPDYAVSVDATLSGPYPTERVRVEQHEIPTEVGEGPVLTLREEGASITQDVRGIVEGAAESAGVNLQVEATSRAGDKRVNPMKTSVPSAILSLPVKYLGTPGELACLQDLEDAVEVVREFSRRVLEGG